MTAPNDIAASLKNPYARARHARYAEKGVVYHIISRTHGNLFLARPDPDGEQRRIVAGILANAQQQCPHIANFGLSMLSNHFHTLLAAYCDDPSDAIAEYMRYFKSEFTRRWKDFVDWPDSIWKEFTPAAIITRQQQLSAFDYLLEQSVKENLVESPLDWPGFHCAETLMTGEPVQGYWFAGTRYRKRVHAEKANKNPREVRREDYREPREFTFARLPALADKTDDEFRAYVAERIDAIVEKNRIKRAGKPVLGAEKVCAMSPMTSAPVADPPWFEERRRFIVWDDLNDTDVKDYLARYWEYQVAFRTASARWREADTTVATEFEFPIGSHIPGRRVRPIPHMEGSGT